MPDVEEDVLGLWMRFWQADPKNNVPITRLLLLADDLASLRFALSDFRETQSALNSQLLSTTAEEFWREGLREQQAELHRRVFHHARTFVVVMRRFARLLEAARSHSDEYPVAIAEAIELSWRAARPHLDAYRVARDAIEHIDGEITGANHTFMGLRNDRLEVVDGIEVPVSQSALQVVERAWTRIAQVICAPAEDLERRPMRRRFLMTLQARVDSLGQGERGAA